MEAFASMYLPLAAVALSTATLLILVFKAVRQVLKVVSARRRFIASPIPGPPLPRHPLGHVGAIVGPRSPWTMLQWTERYGPLYKMMLIDSLAVVLTDPDAIRRITSKTGPGPYMPKPREMYETLEAAVQPKRPNLVSSQDNEYWKSVRQAVAPCFAMSNMKKVVPLVLELSKRAADHMSRSGHDGVFDITDAAKRITSDVMGQLLYGEDLRGTHWEPSEYLDILYPVIKAQAVMFINPFYLWKLWDPEIRLQRRCLSKHNDIMGDKVRRLRKAPPAPHTIAAHILSAIDPATGKPLDDCQAKAEIATFMAAGFETTSHAITWTLTMLAAHPEVQEEVYAELQAAGLAATGATPGRDFEASDLGRLPLLSAVTKEALRLMPPAPFGGNRVVTAPEGTELCGYNVPKGTFVMIPLFCYDLAVRNYGPDALLFKPQRWMAGDSSSRLPTGSSDATTDAAPASAPEPARSEGAAASNNNTASAGTAAAPPDPLTFLTGVRDCVGQNLAKTELQVVLATLLSRFAFSPGPELAEELEVAAATGQPLVSAVHALAGAFITLQPLSGHTHLRIAARG